MKILVLQGPNLNLLGTREPGLYGSASLAEISKRLDGLAGELGVQLEHFQSNHEGVLVDRIQDAVENGYDGAILNAGAYSHTSIALRDALLAVVLPFVEVHISNVHAREPFRRTSLLSDVAVGVVTGFGASSYELALLGLVARLGERASMEEPDTQETERPAP